MNFIRLRRFVKFLQIDTLTGIKSFRFNSSQITNDLINSKLLFLKKCRKTYC